MVTPLTLTLFAAVWAGIIYGLNCLIYGGLKRLELRLVVLYFSAMAMIGLYGEVFLDSIYRFVAGRPLWYYQILPILHGYTSSYAVVTWGLYGFHLYLLHGSLRDKWSIVRRRHLVLLFSVEALVLEAMLTLSARIFLGRYLYYYLPGDLWHVSSFQNLPFYAICGLVTFTTLKRFRTDPIFFSGFSVVFVAILVLFA